MIINFKDLADIRNKHKDKIIVLGGGSFDLLHRGHVEYISSLKEYGDIIVVMVKGDESIRKHKGADRPVIPEDDRVKMVDSLKDVDYAFISPYDPTGEIVANALRPNVFVSTNPEWNVIDVEKVSAKLIINQRFISGHFDSTSSIIKKIKES